MKVIITLLALISFSALSLAQNSGRTPVAQEPFGNEPPIIRSPRENNTASEAVAVLTTIRTGLKTTNNRSEKPVFTEEDYQKLTTNADNFMLQRKYDDAILLYNEILKDKNDQYAKDRILEARALQAKQQKEEDQRKKDEILRAKAEFASSSYGKGIVHFTGALMADESSLDKWTSKAFDTKDPYSDFLQPGKYNLIADCLPKSGSYTLDGIAIPANTHLIVYRGPNCTGNVLLDVTGPAIVNNGYRSDYDLFKGLNTKRFNDELEPYFPPATRSWSTTNMHGWYGGSIEIKVGDEE